MIGHVKSHLKPINPQTSEFVSNQNSLLQRKCACGGTPGVDGECEECHEKRLSLQRSPARPAVSSQAVPPIVHEVLGSSGQPLDAGTRAFMEGRFGHNFSDVRIHTDAKAAESARAVNALAYTVGRDVMFGVGQYAPRTSEGKKLMAHELTHVIQQRSRHLLARANIGQPGDTYEQEADRMAKQMVQPQPDLSEHPHISVSRDTPGVVRRKLAAALPVPEWYQLPEHAQADLAPRGYTQSWFDQKSPNMRLTVLNLYVKLRGMDLWKYVGSEQGTDVGRLVFASSDVAGLKKALTDSEAFTSPEKSDIKWSSREMRVSDQLHFKHFEGWKKEQVEAHIDQYGLLMKSKWWWVPPATLIPLGEMLMHALTYDSYKDVEGIRDILLDQGWDPATLKGVRREGDYPTPSSVTHKA